MKSSYKNLRHKYQAIQEMSEADESVQIFFFCF